MKNNTYYITKENFIFDNIILSVEKTKFGTVRQLSILDGSKILNGESDEESTVYKINFNDSDRSSSNKKQLKHLALDILKSLKEDDKTSKSNDIFSVKFAEPTINNVYSFIGDTGKIFIFYTDDTVEVVTLFWEMYTDEIVQSKTFENIDVFFDYVQQTEEAVNYFDYRYEEELDGKPIGTAIQKWVKKPIQNILFQI